MITRFTLISRNIELPRVWERTRLGREEPHPRGSFMILALRQPSGAFRRLLNLPPYAVKSQTKEIQP